MEELKKEVHERLGIDAKFEYEDEEIPIITALNVSIANFIKNNKF